MLLNSNMKSWHKVAIAFTVTVTLPAIVGLLLGGGLSSDVLIISLPGLMFMCPLLAVALVVGLVFKARRSAVAVYIVGTILYLAFAVSTLWAELHGPLFGYVYIPALLISFPFGLWATFCLGTNKGVEQSNAGDR